ncbi:MAG: toxin-antitoxin system YwqK family antitoxin [Flavobacteriales bacterium]
MKIHVVSWVACCIFWISCGENKGEETADVTDKTITENKTKTKIVAPDGPYKEYYKGSEQIRIEGTMSGGKKEGEWKSYYPNGTSFSTNNFAGGKLNGKTITYHSNGQIRYVGYYTDGKPSGTWLIFNEKGEQIEEKEYK